MEKLDILLPSYRAKTISRERLLSELREVARDRGDSIGSRSIRSPRALDGLNLRVLRRWAATHYEAKSDVPVRRLMVEALNNPNYKVTRELLRIGRVFPHRRQIAAAVSRFICERRPQFEYHEAELLRALRHFHELPDEIYAHAERNAMGSEYDPYIRVQSAMVLMRRPGELSSASRIVAACLASPELQVILVGVLCSSLDRPQAVVAHLRGFATHASHEVARLVQYIRALRREEEPRQALLSFVFGVRETLAERVYGYSAFLRLISTGDAGASRALIELCDEQLARRFLNRELRRFLGFLRSRSQANLVFLAHRSQTHLE